MNDKADLKRSLIKEKNYQFALNIIELYKVLIRQNEYIMKNSGLVK